MISRQLFRYAFCGGMNLALDAVWYFVIYHFLIGEGRMIDLGFVYMSAPIASLFLVFRLPFSPVSGSIATWRSVRRRSGAHATAALCVVGRRAIPLTNYLCMKLFVEVVGIWPTPASSRLSLLSAAYSFLAARYFTFRGAIEGLSLKIIHYGMLERAVCDRRIVIMRISESPSPELTEEEKQYLYQLTVTRHTVRNIGR